MTIATVSTVLASARTSAGQVRRPRTNASTSVPKAPMPAASVAVKTPPYMPPITSANRAATAQTSRRATRRSASVARACVCGASSGLRQVHDGDGEMNSSGQQDAGKDAGQEQLADRLLGEEAVDQEDHARGNEDAERAAGGDRARRKLRVVAELAHLRQRHCRHRCCRRHAGAADGGEARAGGDRRHRRPPRRCRSQVCAVA